MKIHCNILYNMYVKPFNTHVIVAGCRWYRNYDYIKIKLDEILPSLCHNLRDELVILSGGAAGVDSLGERYAEECGYRTIQFKADWHRYGRSAGPIRNEQMAKYAEYLIAFWDDKSRGTKNMIQNMQKLHKYYIVVPI